MQLHEVNLKFRTPGGRYCNAETLRHNERGSECCRFCVDKAKVYGKKVGSGSYCMLWAQGLSNSDGLIEKCLACSTAVGANQIDYIEMEADADPRLPLEDVSKVVKKELKRAGREIKRLVSKGLPTDISIDMGVDSVVSEWK